MTIDFQWTVSLGQVISTTMIVLGLWAAYAFTFNKYRLRIRELEHEVLALNLSIKRLHTFLNILPEDKADG
jgi:hypothetical protein